MSTNNTNDLGATIRRQNYGPGRKRSGFDAFARNERAMELLHAYLAGQIKNQEILLAQLWEANVKICLRTLKTYLSIAKIRRSRKATNMAHPDPAMGRLSTAMAQQEEIHQQQYEEEEEAAEEFGYAAANNLENPFELDMEEFDEIWQGKFEPTRRTQFEAGSSQQFGASSSGNGAGPSTSTSSMAMPSNHSSSSNMPLTNSNSTSAFAAEFVNALEAKSMMKEEQMETPEKLLDAALEWIMADERAMDVLGTDAFKKFFNNVCKIQLEHSTHGAAEPLEFPNQRELGLALDRHLAKIDEQRRELEEQQSRIMGLRQSLKK